MCNTKYFTNILLFNPQTALSEVKTDWLTQPGLPSWEAAPVAFTSWLHFLFAPYLLSQQLLDWHCEDVSILPHAAEKYRRGSVEIGAGQRRSWVLVFPLNRSPHILTCKWICHCKPHGQNEHRASGPMTQECLYMNLSLYVSLPGRRQAGGSEVRRCAWV